jgi:hypothetical protein
LALIVVVGFSRRLAYKLIASNPTLSSNIFFIRINVGFAYILQAAVRLASRTLRIPPASMLALSTKNKSPF